MINKRIWTRLKNESVDKPNKIKYGYHTNTICKKYKKEESEKERCPCHYPFGADIRSRDSIANKFNNIFNHYCPTRLFFTITFHISLDRIDHGSSNNDCNDPKHKNMLCNGKIYAKQFWYMNNRMRNI